MSERAASSPRRAKVWRADPTLLSRRAASALASDALDAVAVAPAVEEPPTRFGTYDAPMALDGFALERYPQLDQPLSALSRQAMARFDADGVPGPVSETAGGDASTGRAAPAAYVPDALLAPPSFVAVDWEPDFDHGPGAAADGVAQPATAPQENTPAQPCDVADASAEQADAASEEGEPLDLSDALATEEADGLAADATAGDVAQNAAPEAAPAPQHDDAHPDAPAEASPAEDTAIDGVPTDASPASDDAPPADAAHLSPDAQDASADASADTAAAATEEVAQDAAPLDAGLIELTEAALAEDELMTPATWDATEQERVEAVLAQAEAPGVAPDEVAQREAEHYARGHADGEQAAREAMAQEVATERDLFANATQELKALLQGGPQQFFEPLKRLAMHLAEHVVLHELQTSTRAIEVLVQRCLDTLDQPPQGMVTLEVNPQDKQRLQAALPESLRGMRLDAVEDMRPGSVRVFANDTIVEDLIAHRLTALARGLQLDVDAWQAQSPLLHDRAPEPEPEPEPEVAVAADTAEAAPDVPPASSDEVSGEASPSSPVNDPTESDDVSS